MGARPVTWTFTRSPLYGAPAAITEKFPDGALGVRRLRPTTTSERRPGEVRREETTLTATGQLPLELETSRTPACRTCYTLEGDVEDVSRQHIANRASVTVHPAPWYIGVRAAAVFRRAEERAEDRDRRRRPRRHVAVAGVPVEVKLTQIQWNERSPRRGQRLLHVGHRAQGSARRDVDGDDRRRAGSARIPLPNGGYFILEARADAAPAGSR